MNENINLIEILKDAPKGTKLWSPLFGECKFIRIGCIKGEDYQIPIIETYSVNGYDLKNTITHYADFLEDGKLESCHSEDGECMLFPSKNNRDWSTFKAPKLPEQKWKDGDILFNDTRQEFAVFENECLFNTDRVTPYFVTNCGKCLTNESICKRDFRLATNAEITLFYRYLRNNGKDWDAKKKRLVKLRWKPKIKEIYWFINNLDGHLGYAPFTNDTFDNDNYNLGNCFRTKEEAEIAAEKIKRLLKEE